MMMYSFCRCGQGAEGGCCCSIDRVDDDDPIESLVAWMCTFTSVHEVVVAQVGLVVIVTVSVGMAQCPPVGIAMML